MTINTNDPKYHARKMRWYWKNKSKALDSSKSWYERNRDKVLAASKEWRKNNKLKVAYNAQKHAAKKRGIEWNFSYEVWSKVWTESGKLAKRGRRADEQDDAPFNTEWYTENNTTT